MHQSAEWQAFDWYLRTGRRLALSTFIPSPIETKFNPNHDPQNGQFTFGSGSSGNRRDRSKTWGGGGFTGGGGGSFVGGGSGGGRTTGSWQSAPARPLRPEMTKPTNPQIFSSGSQVVVRRPKDVMQQGYLVVRNGYSYRLDTGNRTTQVTGTLMSSVVQRRSRFTQKLVGVPDRLPTDDGGHFIAARFNGPTEAFNHFAQDPNINRGGYRVLESQWAEEVKRGKQVYVAISPIYFGSSKRPSTIEVRYLIDGEPFKRTFTNSSKGKTRGK